MKKGGDGSNDKKILNEKMKFLKNQKGLTLIELLVVIVILGIIAAIAIPMVMGNRADAAYNTNAQNLSILQDAVKRYEVVSGAAPVATTTIVELEALLTGEGDGAAEGGPYLDSWPTVKEVDDCKDETAAFTYTADGVGIDAKCLAPVVP